MIKKILVLSFALLVSPLASAHFGIQTMAKVEPMRFVGTWYRIASNPIIFEPSCACARQVLTPTGSGLIEVLNTCNKDNAFGELTQISGTAQAEDASYSKLAVDFGLPWKGQYWIVAAAPDYSWADVTDSFGYSLYIMARKPELSPVAYDEALVAAENANVGIDRLEIQSQAGCVYPPKD